MVVMRIHVVSLLLVSTWWLGCSEPHHAPRVQTTNQNLSTSSRPLYGKASLSEEEKRILYKPFEDLCVIVETGMGPVKHFNEWKTGPKAYKVGMMCLEHRLTRTEVLELISTPPTEDRIVFPNRVDVGYQFRIHKQLLFSFDEKGNLKNAEGEGISLWYKFPSLKDVASDTSIEPPPASAIYRFYEAQARKPSSRESISGMSRDRSSPWRMEKTPDDPSTSSG